jgi:release factor glutamine methyltransferase
MTLQQAKSHLTQQLLFIYNETEAKAITSIALEHITGLSKTQQVSNKNEQLSTSHLHTLQTIEAQLLQYKPIQQIVGYTWFASEKFLVNEHVLIPRPETDELVNWIVEEQKQNKQLTILDIGTGSGCIAISLAKHLKQAISIAIDISEKALQLASQNAKELKAKVEFKQVDFLQLQNWQQLQNIDIIVSNPPYIKEEEATQMHQNVLQHEPHTALFVPNNNALIFYEAIAAFAQIHLSKKGCIYVEINEALGKETIDVFTKAGFKTLLKKDLQQKDRMIKAFY